MDEKKIKDFCIDRIKEDMGVCSPVYRFFKERYGDERADLRDRKDDVLRLIDEGNQEWVVFFGLHLMPQENRLTMLNFVFENALSILGDSSDEPLYTKCLDQAAKVFSEEAKPEDIKELHNTIKGRLEEMENSIFEIQDADSVIDPDGLNNLRANCEVMRAWENIFRFIYKDNVKAVQKASRYCGEVAFHKANMPEKNPTEDKSKLLTKYALKAIALTPVWE